MPDHLADKLQMRYPPRTTRCKQEKQCQGFKNTSGTNVKVKKKEKKKKGWNKQGVAVRGGWYYKGNLSVPSQSGGSWMPPSEEDSTSCQPLYFCYMTQFSQPSPATLRSPVRRCKNNHPGSCSFLFFRGRLRGIKLRHRWTPAINEIHRAYAEYLMRCTALS